MHKVYKNKTRRPIGQQPGTKSGRGPADEPVINHPSTARQPLVVLLYRNLFFPFRSEVRNSCLLCPRRGKIDGFFLGAPARRRPALRALPRPSPPCPTASPPRRPAVRRPAPPRPWYAWVLEPTGQIKTSFCSNSNSGEKRATKLLVKTLVKCWPMSPRSG